MTTNIFGAIGFDNQHTIESKKHLGAALSPIMERTAATPWMKSIYSLTEELLSFMILDLFQVRNRVFSSFF